MYLPVIQLADRYRARAIDLKGRRVLVTNFRGTEQEQDLSEPANCDGFGRVRHFVRKRCTNWVENPLPLDPAAKALGSRFDSHVRAQVFQTAVCSWRCWYCFVPFTLLDANKAHSRMLTAGELLDLWLREPDRPPVIDLTGGQPELVPEWIVWFMEEIQRRDLGKQVYLWSDDNLSTDYFWTVLSRADRETVAGYPLYSRVCCFKGYDPDSFSFNTMAPPEEFGRQFERMTRLVRFGLDLYAYVTFTAIDITNLSGKLSLFVDRLQAIDENLPLRTIPLKIDVFTPTSSRLNLVRRTALENQLRVIEAWQLILEDRFSAELRARRVCDVPLTTKVAHGA